MSTLCRLVAHVKHFSRPFLKNKDVCRTLLSEAYTCQEAWLSRLNSPVLSKIELSDFVIDVYNKLEKGEGTFLDVDILSNKLHGIHLTEMNLLENILVNYRKTQDGAKISRSIIHGIVRGLLEADLRDNLLDFLKDKRKLGLHLDFLSANMLMDHLIKKDMYHEAAKIAFDMMLQEDFSNKVTYLLSLYSTTKYLYHPKAVETSEESVEEAKEEEDEEETWVAIKIIDFPYYDDHFSIQKESFLHGKTLFVLGKELDNVEGRSLQLIGLGMYEKFTKALQMVEKWTEELEKDVITQDSITRFEDSLQNAPTRDPEEPEKDFGLLRIEDEIKKLLLTPDEKEECLTRWQSLKERLQSENKISETDLEQSVTDYVKSELPKYEPSDITELQSLIKSWEMRREELLDKQINDFIKQKKKREIIDKIIALQEKEELLSYFTYENEIKVAKMRAPEPWPEPNKDKMDEDAIEEEMLAKAQEKKKMRRK